MLSMRQDPVAYVNELIDEHVGKDVSQATVDDFSQTVNILVKKFIWKDCKYKTVHMSVN